MLPKGSSPSICVSSEEKVAKLSEFISQDLELRAASAPKAMLALAPQITAAGITVHSIFSALKPGEAPELAHDCRVFRDPRLLAAHEQLVLGPMCAWIGDSMRRDPQKRDALERYSASCAHTAALATTSFKRIWRAAEPLRIDVSLTTALASQLTTIAGANTQSPQTPSRQ